MNNACLYVMCRRRPPNGLSTTLHNCHLLAAFDKAPPFQLIYCPTGNVEHVNSFCRQSVSETQAQALTCSCILNEWSELSESYEQYA